MNSLLTKIQNCAIGLLSLPNRYDLRLSYASSKDPQRILKQLQMTHAVIVAMDKAEVFSTIKKNPELLTELDTCVYELWKIATQVRVKSENCGGDTL